MISAISYRVAQRFVANPQRSIVLALLAIMTACVFIPFAPQMPAARLDDSWALAMNQAVAQGLVFGRDIIFTFGPYAAVFTQTYHPATDARMLVASAYLALVFWLALVYLSRDAKRYLPWAMLLALVALWSSRDALLMCCSLLVGLVWCKRPIERPACSMKEDLFVAALLFSSFGLLPLVKGSLIVPCGLIACVCAGWFALRRRWELVVTALAAPIITLVFSWVVARQPISALGSYCRSLISLVGGYTEAMSLPGSWLEVSGYLIGSGLVVAALLWQPNVRQWRTVPLLTIYLVFLFVAFKAGFVRHDRHAIIAGTSLLAAALLLAGTSRSKLVPVVVLAALTVWAMIDRHYLGPSSDRYLATVSGILSSAGRGIGRRLSSGDRLQSDYLNTLRQINETVRFPVLNGTTDVYSTRQAHLIASGDRWQPRPVIQSYAVFDDYLDRRNREHLLGATAPDNVVFVIEPIDKRLPSLEDGMSWPLLLSRYEPMRIDRARLVLRRRRGRPPRPYSAIISSSMHSFYEQVSVPGGDGLVFAEVTIEPTLLGRLKGVLFKREPLMLTVTLSNGATKIYRLIASMAALGFMISPLVENTPDFAALYQPPWPRASRQVRWFSVTPTDNDALYRPRFRVTFNKVSGLTVSGGGQ